MKKFVEYLIMTGTICTILGGAAAFSWHTWAMPQISKSQEGIQVDVKFLRFVITESVSQKRYQELMQKYWMENGLGRGK
jgi:hypothetical protein